MRLRNEQAFVIRTAECEVGRHQPRAGTDAVFRLTHRIEMPDATVSSVADQEAALRIKRHTVRAAAATGEVKTSFIWQLPEPIRSGVYRYSMMVVPPR